MTWSISWETLRHDFLDARGMDAAIKDEPFHGLAGDLAAHRIKPGKDNRARRVVNQHRDAGGGFEGADIAAFAANDAALHLLAFDVDRGGGGFKTVMARVTLNGQADDLARLFLRPRFGLVKNMLGKLHGVAHAFLFDLFEKKRRAPRSRSFWKRRPVRPGAVATNCLGQL